MTNKKSQMLLPFFALQLIAIIIFFIVLLTLLSLSRDVKYAISEFDESTAFYLMSRRLVSSADCLAYEDKGILYEPKTNSLIYHQRVFPNVIDLNKLWDYENVNCMRKDFYDRLSDVEQGLWDASVGHGAAFKYQITVYDLKDDKYIYPAGDNKAKSLVARVNKSEGSCILNPDFSCSSYGSGWDDCKLVCNPLGDTKCCSGGRCNNGDLKALRPVWKYGESLVKGTTDEACDYTFAPLSVVNESSASCSQYTWSQDSLSCDTLNQSRSTMIPTYIKVEGDPNLHPALIYLQSCVVKGNNYTGRTLCEFAVKPKPGSECT